VVDFGAEFLVSTERGELRAEALLLLSRLLFLFGVVGFGEVAADGDRLLPPLGLLLVSTFSCGSGFDFCSLSRPL
jgi:hypothetical protein